MTTPTFRTNQKSTNGTTGLSTGGRVRRFDYTYDFGDRWDHIIKVEDLVMSKTGAPLILCTAGENACLPEDVGGYPG